MKASDPYPESLLRETEPEKTEKEVKMGDENLEQKVQELEQKVLELEQGEELKSQVLEKLMEKVDQHQATLSDLKDLLAELAPRPDSAEVEQRGYERGLEEVTLAFEQNAVEGEIEPFGRRIYRAFDRMGLLKESEEPPEQEVEEQQEETEEIPLPPYLRVISLEEKEKLSKEEQNEYFGWVDNHWAKLVEAVQ